MPDPREVRSMFARIAPRYDFLNRTLSMGIDRRWRRALLDACGELRGRVALDVCSGTGDVALGLARRGARVVGLDFTTEMLALARAKCVRTRGTLSGVLFAHADAQRLPAADGCAHVCTIAFGIRNVADRGGAMAEMRRVLAPGGRMVILEFGLPSSRILSAAYRAYFTRLLPRIGGWIARDRAAYEYLPRTVIAWPSPRELQIEIESAGFTDCGHALLSGGIACLHWGTASAAEKP